MLDWLFPSKEIGVTLSVPLPTVLERLRTACRPIPLSARVLLAYPVCRITADELVLRRSNTLFGLGLVEFRAPLTLSTRELRGTLQLTLSARLFAAGWLLLWTTVLVLTLTTPPRPAPTSAPLPLWASVLFFGFALGVMPFVFRAALGERHPHRKLIMDVLQRAAAPLSSQGHS